MKIGIDCRLSGLKHAGIGRYTENLISNLLKDTKTNWVLFFNDAQQAKIVLKTNLLNKNVKVVITTIKHYSLQEQLELPKIYNAENLDLLHIPHFNIPIFYSGKIVVTIHDLLWHEHKGGEVTTLSPIKYFLKYFFYKLVINQAVNKSKRIFVPANTIKQTILKFYPKVNDKIIITKEGGKIWDKKIYPDKKLKKTLLYVGSLYPHKNIKLILRSLQILSDYTLIIVGSRSVFREKIEKYVKFNRIEDRVKFLGFIDDEELAKLYLSVTALVQPSFSEGFGLTGVEAMGLGTKLLASDIPIFKEIYQDVAHYFSPHAESSFINAVRELEKSDYKQQKKGILLAKTYSWKNMALKTAQIYQEVVNQ